MQGEMIKYTLHSAYPIVIDVSYIFATFVDKIDDYLPDWLKKQVHIYSVEKPNPNTLIVIVDPPDPFPVTPVLYAIIAICGLLGIIILAWEWEKYFPPPQPCTSDVDCPFGYRCVNGRCQPIIDPWWILGGSIAVIAVAFLIREWRLRRG
jgi:hypothetical protein